MILTCSSSSSTCSRIKTFTYGTKVGVHIRTTAVPTIKIALRCIMAVITKPITDPSWGTICRRIRTSVIGIEGVCLSTYEKIGTQQELLSKHLTFNFSYIKPISCTGGDKSCKTDGQKENEALDILQLFSYDQKYRLNFFDETHQYLYFVAKECHPMPPK